MSTTTPTTKRKRRRYSCGPCKTLKIKCNLQTPCQACKKVGREDKCHEDPPRPPSSEEISISTRRKTLTKRKKQLIGVSEEEDPLSAKHAERDGLEDSSGKSLHKMPVSDTNCSESPSATPGPNNITAELLGNANLEQGIAQNVNYSVLPRAMCHLTIDDTKDHGLDNSYVSNASVPGLFASISSTSLSDNQGTTSRNVSLSSSLLSHSLGGDLEDIRLNPDVNNYEYRNSIQHQIMNEHYLVGTQVAEQPLNTHNFYLSQPNMTIASPNQDQSNPRFYSNASSIEAEDIQSKQVMFTFNNTDLNIFKTFLPAFSILEEFLHHYILSSNYTYYNILDIGEIFSVFKGFFNSISNLSSTDTIKIDKNSLKCISHFYGIMSIGYLLSGWENEVLVNLDKQTVIQGWINISSMIRRIIVDSTKVSDILFSIEWYLIIRDFFTYNNLVLDDYSSFISVVELLKLNKWILDTIKKDTKKISTQADRDVVRVIKYWIYLRIVDLEVPYIMLKGTFIDSTEFENSVVPDKQTFDFLFKDLTNISDPLSNISFDVMKLYFNRTQYTASIKLFLRSYLEFFCDVSSLALDELKDFKKKSLEQNFEQTDSHLRSLVKIQLCQQAAIRWLSFMSIEFTHYFPSLRFASYLTSILNLFNHFNCLDSIIKRQTNNQVSLVDRLLQTYNYGCFSIFVRCLVYQGIFIVTLKNFKNSTNSILNFREIFDIARRRFHDTFTVFWNSNQVHNKLYPNLPLFRNSFDLCHQMCRMVDNDTQFNLLDDFITYLTSELPLYDYLTQNYFASPDDLRLYLEILWQLLTHINTDQSTKLIISELLFLNMDLLNSRLDDPTGLTITSEVVDDFAKLVIEPNIHE